MKKLMLLMSLIVMTITTLVNSNIVYAKTTTVTKNITGNNLTEIKKSLNRACQEMGMGVRVRANSSNAVVKKIVCSKTKLLKVTYSVGPSTPKHPAQTVTKTISVPTQLTFTVHYHEFKNHLVFTGDGFRLYQRCSECNVFNTQTIFVEIPGFPDQIVTPIFPTTTTSSF